MTEYYGFLRHLHVGCAILSISIFVLRSTGTLAGAGWPMHNLLRYLSWTVDSTLLMSALMLTTVIRQYPFATPWLTTKVVLLVPYIVFGQIALSRGRTKRTQAVAMVAALSTVAFLASVARGHDPLGFFAAG